MFSKSLKKIASAAALTAGVALSAGAQAEEVKVGFVYVGPTGDHGWSYQHDLGRQAIEKELGLETSYVENVAEGPDATRVINKLASSGHNLIFTTSFGFMNPTLKAAKRNKNVMFEHATGYKQSKNVATYSSRFYEGRYVVGHIAGKMTKSNTIGYIASFPIPEVIRGINATYLGAKKVNPDIKIKIIWVNSWFDPGKESDAAKTLIDQGADVIMQHTDSPAPIQVAEKRGVWAVGQASDMASFGPKAHLTAIVDNWAPYYIARAKAAMDGTWQGGGDTWGGFSTGMVELAELNSAIPADVQELANSVRAGITDGSIHPFAGPLNDNAGNEIVAAGSNADDGMLARMNVYIEGIDAEVPQ